MLNLSGRLEARLDQQRCLDTDCVHVCGHVSLKNSIVGTFQHGPGLRLGFMGSIVIGVVHLLKLRLE